MSLSEQINQILIETVRGETRAATAAIVSLVEQEAARAEGVAALQQAGEPVAWSRDEIARAVQAEGRTIAAQALLELGWHYQDDPDGISPAAYHIADAILSLPQKTALVGDLTPNSAANTNNTKESS